jgi:hypothetical protein
MMAAVGLKGSRNLLLALAQGTRDKIRSSGWENTLPAFLRVIMLYFVKLETL